MAFPGVMFVQLGASLLNVSVSLSHACRPEDFVKPLGNARRHCPRTQNNAPEDHSRASRFTGSDAHSVSRSPVIGKESPCKLSPLPREGKMHMERSAEVEEITRQIWASMRKGDAQAITDLIAPGEDVLWIGTDPDEWWSGAEKVKSVIAEQLQATGGFDIVGTDPTGFVEGDVAWVGDRGTIRLPDGTEIPIRATGVLRRQQGGWRIVQFHASVGVANEEVLGQELPT